MLWMRQKFDLFDRASILASSRLRSRRFNTRAKLRRCESQMQLLQRIIISRNSGTQAEQIQQTSTAFRFIFSHKIGKNKARCALANLFPMHFLLFRHCNFDSSLARFKLLHYVPQNTTAHAQFVASIVDLLIERALPANQTLRVAHALRDGAQAAHATRQTSERRAVAEILRSDPHLLRRLVQIFYYDYALFGFALPSLTDV